MNLILKFLKLNTYNLDPESAWLYIAWPYIWHDGVKQLASLSHIYTFGRHNMVSLLLQTFMQFKVFRHLTEVHLNSKKIETRMFSYICTAFLPLAFSKMTSVLQTARYRNQSTHFNIILVFRKTLSDKYTNISITFMILQMDQ